MARTAVAVAIVLGLAGFAPARAQWLPGPPYGPGFHGGFGFSAGGPGFRVTGVVGGYPPRWGWAAPPYYGWGLGYGNPYLFPPLAALPPPVIVVPPPVIVFGNNPPADPFAAGPGTVPPSPPPAPRDPGDVLPPGSRPGQYLVISPKGATGPAAARPPVTDGTITPKLDRVAPPPAAAKPLPFLAEPFPNRVDAKNTEKAEADPAAEATRQVKQAREAFAAGEYGRAVEHLDRAIRARPDEPLAYLLKAQVRFAAGQYADAVAGIREGLKRAPDWPTTGFDPKALYGPRAGDYEVHLGALRKALAENPGEPGLQFLLGYQLWFAGDRPAAVKLFRDAAGRVKDPAAIEPFLRAAEGK